MEVLPCFWPISGNNGKDSSSRGKQFPLKQQGVQITLMDVSGWGEVKQLQGEMKSHRSLKKVWLCMSLLEKILLVAEISLAALFRSLWLNILGTTNLSI